MLSLPPPEWLAGNTVTAHSPKWRQYSCMTATRVLHACMHARVHTHTRNWKDWPPLPFFIIILASSVWFDSTLFDHHNKLPISLKVHLNELKCFYCSIIGKRNFSKRSDRDWCHRQRKTRASIEYPPFQKRFAFPITISGPSLLKDQCFPNAPELHRYFLIPQESTGDREFFSPTRFSFMRSKWT